MYVEMRLRYEYKGTKLKVCVNSDLCSAVGLTDWRTEVPSVRYIYDSLIANSLISMYIEDCTRMCFAVTLLR